MTCPSQASMLYVKKETIDSECAYESLSITENR